MSLECLVVRKQEKVLKIQKDEGMSKGQGTSVKGVMLGIIGQNHNNLDNKMKNIVLDYNPQYNISIHGFILL